MASISSSSVLILLLGVFAPLGEASTFLSKEVKGDSLSLSKAIVEQRFLEEVRSLTGKARADVQIPAIRSALEPMWLALPKNQYGGLDETQVRYALHRLFVQRHGWYIDGLTGATNESSPAEIMRERVPTFIMELFEEAFGHTGLKLHELVVFAATLEALIHDETVERLKDVYSSLELQQDVNLHAIEADRTMKAFVMSLILRKDLKKPGAVSQGFKFLDRNYPAWGEMQAWLAQVRQDAAPTAGESYSFEQMSNATEQISMRLGSYLDSDCRKMKDALLEEEIADTGRVLLSSFYKKGLEKELHFVEKADYMRKLGALDDSHPGEPQVIVSNFIVSPNNCLVDNGFYSICCLNECEDVMAKLEKSIGSPEATPEKIVSVIEGIDTTSVKAPRTLPRAMVVRLELVAERNGGMVPMYGRLFNQWLHFAFPRECPYPHTTGSITAMSPDDYTRDTSEKPIMTYDAIHEYIANAGTQEADQELSTSTEQSIDLHWSDEEEHFFLPVDTPRSFASKLLRGALTVLLLAGVVVAGVDAARRFSGMQGILPKPEKAHLV